MLRKLGRFGAVVAMLLAVTLVLSACGGTGSDGAKDKKDGETVVGFVYIGHVNDGGWTQAHEEGRLLIEKELGVKTIYKEAVDDQTPDSEKVMRDLIDQGANIIFATSFGYIDYVEKLSKEFPDVTFFHCSGYKVGDNLTSYFGKMYQARYLAGIVAGMKTQNNKIGYVAAYEIPEVIRMINAFTMGVRSVKPDAKVYVNWTHTWYDPTKEKDAAIALLEQYDVDVMAQHQDTAGPQIAAQEKGRFAIGYNFDNPKAAPQAYLTSPVWDWGSYYVPAVKSVMDKTYKSENYWGGLETGIIKLAPLTDLVAVGTAEKVKSVEDELKAGRLDIFKGPLKDNEGKERVASGLKLSDKDIYEMDWFVDGVVGKIEK